MRVFLRALRSRRRLSRRPRAGAPAPPSTARGGPRPLLASPLATLGPCRGRQGYGRAVRRLRRHLFFRLPLNALALGWAANASRVRSMAYGPGFVSVVGETPFQPPCHSNDVPSLLCQGRFPLDAVGLFHPLHFYARAYGHSTSAASAHALVSIHPFGWCFLACFASAPSASGVSLPRCRLPSIFRFPTKPLRYDTPAPDLRGGRFCGGPSVRPTNVGMKNV